jgi:Leucine-rich repeat (LRR) protein
LDFNDLTFIPALSFPPNLDYLSLYNNRIRDVSFTAFAGTNITQLDLNMNRIDQTYVEIFWPVNATLQYLYMEYNLMYYLPENALANLRNLRFIDMTGNDFSDRLSIPSNAFVGGENLEILSLTDAGISHLDPQWFESMPNLSVLYLYNNRLTFLPVGIFAPLSNLMAIHLSSNFLTELRVSSFGTSLRNVWYFYAMANQLDGIQNEFIDELQSTQWLMLTENNCVNQIFLDIPNNRENVRNALSGCITNFRQPSISCQYFGGEDGTEYFCIMDVHNPDGVAFNAIEGEHVAGQTNTNVVSANAFYQNTRTIPSVICRQFPNLERMMITGSGIEEILPENLENCANLRELYVHVNRIRTIAAGTFVNAPNLRVLELGYNEISRVENGAFRGTSLDLVDLYNNWLSEFTPGIFEGATTLTYVDMSFNRLRSIPENAFSSLTNLRHLILSSNPIEENLPPSALRGLSNLLSLGMSRTITRVLNPGWFTDLTSLQELYFNNNLLREINSTVFAPVLPTLQFAYFGNNYINMIDQLLLMEDSTPNLEYLRLSGNLCVDEDFLNLGESRWRIFEALMPCSNNFYETPWLACDYVAGDDYTCQISVQNPRGINFDTIDGQHLAGRNATDVTALVGIYQSTVVVPPIICRTFTNLRTILMWYSGLQEIQADTLRDCRNLEVLDLQLNWIWRIDPSSFIGAQRLHHLELSNNRLSTLPFNAFHGAPLEFIDLAFNQLTEFNHWHFTSAAPTLETLELIGNQITQIRPMSFLDFRNLKRLMLNNNPLSDVPRDAFDFLNNLFDLYIANTGISRLDPEWFRNLPALEELHINGNNIGELPEGIFAPLPRLRQLFMYNNQIRSLNANQFGQLQTLTHILAQNNRIRAVDPVIIERARNLDWLMMSGNICNNDDFSNVQLNRQFVIQRLGTCFYNSGPERLLCNYRAYDDEDYICSLNIFNPLGREQFVEVEGEHVEGRQNTDVRSLYGAYANTLNFPARICLQFRYLVEISMLYSGIEYIDDTSFAGCDNIVSITLHANLIQSIPDFIFTNNPRLEVLSIERNGLNWISPFAFWGTSLNHLDIANNPLTLFDPNWTASLGQTLRILNLMNTQLQGLPVGAFDATPNLVDLTLANNPFVDLDASTFTALTQLDILTMGNTNLVGLNLEWFRTLTALRTLNLQGNNLFELPAYIFSELRNLTNLYIYNNNIRDIDLASFGSSIGSIETLSAQYNQIMGIDPEFLNQASNLNILYLSGNNCSGENFYDVLESRNNVSTALQQCFTNFASEFLTCEYYETGYGDYACRLTISNPIGRDAFTVVPGEHLPGRTNADVTEIDFMNQNTRNIPAIICEQFSNIRLFIAWGSNIDLITPRSFAGCGRMEELVLFENNINNIPPNTFANNPLLTYLELGGNRISTLHPQSFEGSSIELLDLAFNQISVFDPTWYSPINATLRTLDLLDNRISGLPSDAFRSLRDLETLVLSGNPLRGQNIPGNAFIALDNLQILLLGNSHLGSLNSNWFTALRNLQILGLYNAGIEVLPNNIFNPLVNIDTIIMNDNFIWEITNGQFGASVETLRVLNLQNNVVNMIDASMVTSATNLTYLLLSGNVCSNQDFNNVADYLWMTLEYLQECTSNFVDESTISCQYSNLQADVYMCTLASQNPRGFNRFTSISGDHLEGNSNENVAFVYSNGANMRTIPSVICQQFPAAWEFMFTRSRIEQISEASFQHCASLQFVFIMENLLRVIPDNTFANSPNMVYLSVNLNRITTIGPNAFRGTRISDLDLANNRIEVFDPRTYEAINITLTALDFLNNRLRGFPYAAFEQVANIRVLTLNGNPLTNLPFEFLYPLWDLEILSMAHCQLTELHHTWFFNSINLQQLYVNDNLLPEFQDGVFHNMTSLELVYFQENQITDLRSISFGMSIPTLRVLRGDDNTINAIEASLIEDAVGLEYLLLNNNLCVSDSFFNVRDNLADVQAALQGCFNNFGNRQEIEGY